jgi:hypothetical protein
MRSCSPIVESDVFVLLSSVAIVGVCFLRAICLKCSIEV